jgi:outer membrane protein assembly factor BamB
MKVLFLGFTSSSLEGHSPDRRRRRLMARLLALGAVVALAAALTPAPAIAAPGQPGVTVASDWPQFRNGPRHQGYDAQEQELSASNVASLGLTWTGATGSVVDSSPAVANGVVYIGSMGGTLYAYAAGCASGGGTCTPLWTATTGGYIFSSPAVANGVVYVGSKDLLYAFDATGVTGCGGSPKTCSPLWTGATGGLVDTSPTVSGGVVYVGSYDKKLYAFDATGVTGCGGSPKTCSPLWTGATGGEIHSSPAVADGVVYVGSNDDKLYAYAVGCNSGGGTCSPLWTGATGSTIYSSPAVANGVVYVGSYDKKLYAFDAAGVTDCGGGTCSPLWTGATGGEIYSSSAVANGVVYVGSYDKKLYAFDAAGVTGCGGGTCTPLWTASTGGSILSSPAVANGVVYVGSGDHKLYAYAVGCNSGNGTCSPLWTSIAGDIINSSPTVANGMVYVGSNDGKLRSFSLSGVLPATYHAITPTRVLDTRNGTGGLSGPFTNHAARTFQVTGGSSGVPAGAAAVTGNLTVTGQTSSGYLFIGPIATNNPTSSTLNFPVGDDRANAVTVALGAGGTLSITFVAPTNGPTAQAIFDVTGYFTSDTSGATYHALIPARALDSRNGTGGLSGPFTNHAARTFQVTGGGSGVPAGATAVTGNLTVTGQTSNGYLYVGPVAANNPGSSTLNFPVGDDRANAVTVALGTGGTLSITFVAPSSGPSAHAIFDVTGYFTADMTGAVYVPLNPTRILDTRNGTGGLSGPFTNHAARSFAVTGAPSHAIAVTGNLTVTGQTSNGYLFIGPAPTNNPTSSTLNFPVADDRANAVTVATSDGGTLSITFVAPSNGPTAHAIFDLTGFYEP